MPMHDWTKVDAGIYHAFHSIWITHIHESLSGRLPEEYYALPEQCSGPYGPDVLTLKRQESERHSDTNVNTATLIRPKSKIYQESDLDFYTRKRKSIVIRHVSGDDVVAVIELVSPGNKDSKRDLKKFVDKSIELLSQYIHLTVIDPFPPGPRDSHGLHAEIFKEYDRNPVKLPEDSPLCAFAYECDDIGVIRSYIEPFAVGDSLPDIPVFLYPEMYVSIPLESTYMKAWNAFPKHLKTILEGKA